MGEPDGDATDARNRILRIARDEVTRGGWAAATSGRVAQRAGVSKALIHYHFRDKPSLIVAVAKQCGENIAMRAAGGKTVSSDGISVDEFIEWLEAELRSGDLRVAVLLRCSGPATTRRAADGAFDVFRRVLQQQVGQVFVALGLTARIGLDLIAEVFAVAAQGMSVAPVESDAWYRQVLETLWLSTLGLAE